MNQLANKPDWAAVYFTAEEMQDVFENVIIVTLKQHYFDEAQKFYYQHGGRLSDVINSGLVQVRPFIKHVKNEPLVICLDVETVDDDTVFMALDQLWLAFQEYPNFLDLDQATIDIGEPVTFNTKQLDQWLVK